MKKLQAILLCIIFITGISCENDQEAISPQNIVEESSLDVDYIAENYYKQLPYDDVVRIADAYRSMDYEQMTSYIEARYQIDVAAGMETEKAVLIRDLRHKTNEEVFNKTGHSYASADQDVSAKVFHTLSQHEKYATLRSEKLQEKSKTARVPSCDGNWFKTKNTPWLTYKNGTSWDLTYLGKFNFNGNSSDCDYIFRSVKYNIYFKTSHVWPLVAASRNILTQGGSTVAAREPAINSSEAIFEFLVGKGRVDLEYFGSGAPSHDLFVADTRINLIPR